MSTIGQNNKQINEAVGITIPITIAGTGVVGLLISNSLVDNKTKEHKYGRTLLTRFSLALILFGGLALLIYYIIIWANIYTS
jgi:hypothetical protein